MVVQMVVGRFVEHTCRHPWFISVRPKIVPIVECNNNEIMAMSILEAIKQSTRAANCIFYMPFTRAYFTTGITENLGVSGS